MNTCEFSADRTYRYSLTHDLREEFALFRENGPKNKIAWIGLNPSTADEQQLDPTLRRVREFTRSFGGNVFVMLNLFAFRATLPENMKAAQDPVGPDNDQIILKHAREASMVIAAWGNDGLFGRRDTRVTALLEKAGIQLMALKITGKRCPSHPLYLPKTLKPFRI